MTEDETKTKWCPFARGMDEDSGQVGANRDLYGRPIDRCIGADCMAWRWSSEPIPERTFSQEVGTHIPRVKIGPPDARAWTAVERGRDVNRGGAPYRWVIWGRHDPPVPGHGYCGLAGAQP